MIEIFLLLSYATPIKINNMVKKLYIFTVFTIKIY
jgi:hypothetical protein